MPQDHEPTETTEHEQEHHDLAALQEEDESLFVEFYNFLRVRKKFWLAPIILALVLLGLLFALAVNSGPLAPFIYAM